MEPLQNDKKALGEISSLNLAYIGDGVYELMVRERLLRQGGRVRDLHTLAVEQVRAEAQAVAADPAAPPPDRAGSGGLPAGTQRPHGPDRRGVS